MKFYRILILVTPLIILLLFEFFVIFPKAIYFLLILANLVIFFTIWVLHKHSLNQGGRKFYLSATVQPALFLTTLAFYSVLISNKIVIQSLFLANSFFIYFYLRNFYYYIFKPNYYKSQILENISSYGNFLIIFFLSSFTFGLQSFLNIPIWILITIILPIIALVIYNVMWINKINFKIGFIYILVSCLILTEISWSLSFLPLNYNISGLVLAICYYVIVGLIRYYLRGDLNKRIVKFYLSFGLISISLILLTARWM
ncbi:MAG: hypothetical protein ABIE43_05035 [Patescibacteria group bacterium]